MARPRTNLPRESNIGQNLYGRELALIACWRINMRKLIWLLALTPFAAFQALATTVEKFSLDDLVQKSGRIIVGKCISSESRWNDRNTLILTTARFAVSEPLKGSSDGFVNVVTVGGTLDGITQEVSGMPVFEPEEEVLLFLEPSKNGQWQPLGMSQGKFRILRNRQTGEQEVVHSLSGLEFYDPASRSLSQQEKPSRAPLKPMVERIRRMVRN
jgi:hypothetical protein